MGSIQTVDGIAPCFRRAIAFDRMLLPIGVDAPSPSGRWTCAGSMPARRRHDTCPSGAPRITISLGRDIAFDRLGGVLSGHGAGFSTQRESPLNTRQLSTLLMVLSLAAPAALRPGGSGGQRARTRCQPGRPGFDPGVEGHGRPPAVAEPLPHLDDADRRTGAHRRPEAAAHRLRDARCRTAQQAACAHVECTLGTRAVLRRQDLHDLRPGAEVLLVGGVQRHECRAGRPARAALRRRDSAVRPVQVGNTRRRRSTRSTRR